METYLGSKFVYGDLSRPNSSETGVKVLKTIGVHLLFWMFITTYFAWGFGFELEPKRSFINASLFLPGFMIMAYSLAYFLIPRYLLKRKFLYFFLGLLLVVVVCSLYSIIAQVSLDDSKTFRGMAINQGRNILPYLHVGGFVVSVKLLEYWYMQRQQTLEAEKQKSQAELKLLRAQLHPHFLFNTLNNLYAHTLEQSIKAPEIVLKLSSLLRFMIYESNASRISLEKEVQLLLNYIGLEKLRYGDRIDISVSIDGDVKDLQIAPLILLPFLENAFKHGTSKQIDQCWLRMDLHVDGNELHFKLVNSLDPELSREPVATGGVGLENLKRRLELLYGEKHEVKTRSQQDVFIARLKLELEPLEECYKDNLMP